MHGSSYEKACWGISKSAVTASKQEIWLSPAWRSGASVSLLIPAMTKFSRGDPHDGLLLWAGPGFMMTTCRHCNPRDQSSIWRTLPTLLTLVHKIISTPESDLRPPNYITWDQAAVLKYKWMEINFRTKVLQKTNKGSPCFFFYSHIYLFRSFKIHLFVYFRLGRSSLLRMDFLWLWPVGATLWFWCSGFSPPWPLFSCRVQALGCEGFRSCDIQA